MRILSVSLIMSMLSVSILRFYKILQKNLVHESNFTFKMNGKVCAWAELFFKTAVISMLHHVQCIINEHARCR